MFRQADIIVISVLLIVSRQPANHISPGLINQMRPADMEKGRLLTGNYSLACAIIPLFLTDSVNY